MTLDLHASITNAFKYLDEKSVEVPLDLSLKALSLGVFKAASDLAAINATYHDAITQSLTQYFEGGSLTGPRNQFRKGGNQAFQDSFMLGWQDGGGTLPLDDAALSWLGNRIQEEWTHIDGLFQQAKELRKEKDFDYFSWINDRADGYTGTLVSVYNQGKLRAKPNIMLTFGGADGDQNHICQSINGTCVKLMGKRHKASWWLAHDLVPYPGNPNYDCGAWRCRHKLSTDDGNPYTLPQG